MTLKQWEIDNEGRVLYFGRYVGDLHVDWNGNRPEFHYGGLNVRLPRTANDFLNDREYVTGGGRSSRDITLEEREALSKVDHYIPGPGTPLTLGVGSDCYPYEVTAVVSPTKIRIRKMRARVVSGTWTRGDAVVEYSSDPSFEEKDAKWSRARQRWMYAGSPLYVGAARYYQDPSV